MLRADLTSPDLQFEALSYVWGASDDAPSSRERLPRPLIHLDGHELPITVNLARALRALRLRDAVRFIWVDAISINQDDAHERGHQVTLMSSIYRNATQVIIWLGEPPSFFNPIVPDSHIHDDVQGERSFGAICDVVNHWLSTRVPGLKASYGVVGRHRGVQHVRVGSSMPDMMEVGGSEAVGQRHLREGLNLEGQEENGLAETPHWEALCVLFDRSWFWRLWVFQEIVLARTAVARMGHIEINWKWIGLAAAILRTNYQGICETTRLGGVYNAYLMFRSSSQSDIPRIKFDFLRLLRLTRQFEVTDPRDRIYALLGITTTDNEPNKGRILVRADYTISTGELWKRLAVILLAKSNDLSLLSCVQYSAEKLESERRRYQHEYQWGWQPEQDSVEVSVPSWVPQWNLVYRATISPWDGAEHFSTAQGLPRTMGNPLTSETLVLQGIEIGIVGHGLPFMWHEADISLLQSEHLKSFFRTEAGLRMLTTTLTAGRNSYGSILKHDAPTPADLAAYVLSWEGHKPHHGDGWSVSSWYGARRPQQARGRINSVAADLDSAFLENLAVGGDATRFAEIAVQYCECRRLFLTMNGYLGLGPDTLQEGDVLCVLGGGDVPYILRPVKSNDYSKMKYLLVGECYVDGLMSGEAVVALAQGRILAGAIPPDLILQTIVDATKQESQVLMRYPSSQVMGEENDIKQLLVAAQSEYLEKSGRLPIPQKSWFEIC